MLHYIGHAVYDPSAGSGFVLLEDADGNGQPVSEAQLQAILRDQAGLRLVYLNACEGAQNSGVDNFTGIAQTLVQAGVPAVIGMMQTVGDGTAAQLAGEFYESVAEGYPVDAALAEARKAIFLQDGDLSWGLPVLFSRSRDNRLIAAPEQETQPLMVVPSKSMWQRPLLWIALLVIAVLVTTAIAVLSPADSRFGWFQAAGDQNNCSRRSDWRDLHFGLAADAREQQSVPGRDTITCQQLAGRGRWLSLFRDPRSVRCRSPGGAGVGQTLRSAGHCLGRGVRRQ